jgi:hypothetical protein
MNSLKKVPRMAAHAAALIFGCWWLVATSAPLEPARDCFTGVANPTRLQVVLGSVETTTPPAPGCNGVDGLVPGSALIFDLRQGPRPETNPVHGQCYGYETQAVAGVDDVTLTGDDRFGPPQFTSASGTFVSAEVATCSAGWSLRLLPETPPPVGELISPLDAGPAKRWLVQRWINPGRTGICDELFADPSCFDAFVVESITEVPAP